MQNLKFDWQHLHVEKRHELRRLQAACDADPEGHAVLVESIQWGNRQLRSGSMIRLHSRVDLLLSELGELPLPEKLEVGRPRDVRTLRLKDLRAALHQAAIYWLREPEDGKQCGSPRVPSVETL